jgi:hypothetical protein
MILWSIPSHILQGAILLPICSFVLGLESNVHTGLQQGQYKVKNIRDTAYILEWRLVQIPIVSDRFPKSKKDELLKSQEYLDLKWQCLLSHHPWKAI